MKIKILILNFLFVLMLNIQMKSQEQISGGILEGKVNCNDEDYNSLIIFAKTGESFDTLFFTSSKPLDNQKIKKAINAEMFFSTRPVSYRESNKKPNEGWSEAKPLNIGINKISDYTRGSQAIGRDRIIFAAERDLSKNNTVGTSYLLDLWQIVKSTEGDGSPESLDNVNEAEAWDSQPALSSDGKLLYFVSNRQGGSGGLDIWYSKLDENQIWSKASPVPNINTPGDEISPHCGNDSKFYFSTNWNFSNSTKESNKDIYRADYSERNGILLPTNPINLDSATRKDASKYGLKISENIRYNSEADDEFPYITSDRSCIYLTSNRKSDFGKRDLYGFSLPKSRIQILVNVSEQIFGPNNDLLIPPTLKLGLTLTLVDSTTNLSQEIKSGEKAEVDPSKTYVVKFSKIVEEECYKNKIEDNSDVKNNIIRTIKPFGADTLFIKDFLISRKKVEISPIIFQATEKIPFFVTGYWYPNTTSNLKVYRDRESTGFFDQTGFVDSTGYDYDINSKSIDSIFKDKLYNPLMKILPIFQDFCRDTLFLKVTVHGYTDPRGLSGGEEHPYRATSKYKHNYNDESITVGIDERGQDVNISKGIDMWKQGWFKDPNDHNSKWIKLPDEGQKGNILLSKLRAYYTFKTFDNEMTSISSTYKQLKDNKRIIFDAEGFGIDKEGFESRKLNDDPQSRRIEIYLDVLRPVEISNHKRMIGGVLKNNKKIIHKIDTVAKSSQVKDEDNSTAKLSSNPKEIEVAKSLNNEEISNSKKPEIDLKDSKQNSNETSEKSKTDNTPVLNGCYSIQYNTYFADKDAQFDLKILQKNGLGDAEVVIFQNNSGKIIYRLRAGCYETIDDALFDLKNQSAIIKQLNLTTKPVIVR